MQDTSSPSLCMRRNVSYGVKKKPEQTAERDGGKGFEIHCRNSYIHHLLAGKKKLKGPLSATSV